MTNKHVHIQFYTKDLTEYINNIVNTSYFNKKTKTVYINIIINSSFVNDPDSQSRLGISVSISGLIAKLKSKRYSPSNEQLLAINCILPLNNNHNEQKTLSIDTNGNISTINIGTDNNNIYIGANAVYHIYGSFRLSK